MGRALSLQLTNMSYHISIALIVMFVVTVQAHPVTAAVSGDKEKSAGCGTTLANSRQSAPLSGEQL